MAILGEPSSLLEIYECSHSQEGAQLSEALKLTSAAEPGLASLLLESLVGSICKGFTQEISPT